MLLSLSAVPHLGSRSAKPPLKLTQPSVVVKTASKHPADCGRTAVPRTRDAEDLQFSAAAGSAGIRAVHAQSRSVWNHGAGRRDPNCPWMVYAASRLSVVRRDGLCLFHVACAARL